MKMRVVRIKTDRIYIYISHSDGDSILGVCSFLYVIQWMIHVLFVAMIVVSSKIRNTRCMLKLASAERTIVLLTLWRR